MGSSQSTQKNLPSLVLFDMKPQNIQHLTSVIKKKGIEPFFEKSIESIKINYSPNLLRAILTTDKGKDHINKMIQKDNFKTNIYVWIQQKSSYQMNALDQNVVLASKNIDKLLDTIKNQDLSIDFNPLATIFRELKVKINVKIIEPNIENSIFKYLYNRLLQSNCSIQVCSSLQAFLQSQMFSQSDIIIRHDRHDNQQKDQFIIKNRLIYFKDIQVDVKNDTQNKKNKQDEKKISLSPVNMSSNQSQSQKIKQQKWIWYFNHQDFKLSKKYQIKNMSSYPKHYNIQWLPKFIDQKTHKQGYFIKKYTNIFIISRTNNKGKKKKERRLQKINKIKELYHQTQQKTQQKRVIYDFDNNENLFKTIKQEIAKNKIKQQDLQISQQRRKILDKTYIVILFIHMRSSNMKVVRQKLIEQKLDKNVLITTLKSFPIDLNKNNDQVKLKDIEKGLYFKIENKLAKCVDISHAQSVINGIKNQLTLFTQINEIKFDFKKNENQIIKETKKSSEILISSYETISKIQKHNPELFKQWSLFICYDNNQNSLLMHSEKIFTSDKTIVCAYSVKKIIQIIRSYKTKQLITYEQTVQNQAILYKSFTNNHQILLRKGRIKNIDGKIQQNHYQMLQQISFFCDKKKNSSEAFLMDDYLSKFTQLWKLDYVPTSDFERFKQNYLGALIKLKRNQVIKTSFNTFQSQYKNRVSNCKSLPELVQLTVYLFSLPHGLNSSLNYLLKNFTTNLRMVNVYKPLFFALLLNYTIVFQPKYHELENKTFKTYFQNQINIDQFKVGEKVYNLNFLQCWDTLKKDQNCIQIKYVNYPIVNNSPYSNILRTEMFSFYKANVEYTFCPFSCFQIQKVQNNRIVVKNIPNEGLVKKLLQSSLQYVNPIDILLQKVFPSDDLDQENQGNQEQTNKKWQRLTKQQQWKQEQQILNKQKMKLYSKFLESISDDKLNLAEHYYQNFFKVIQQLQKNNNTKKTDLILKTYRDLDWIFLNIKKGQFDKVQMKLNKILNFVNKAHLNTINIANIKNKNKAMIKKRKEILDKTELLLFKSDKIKKCYDWECRYQQSVDQFVLLEDKQNKINLPINKKQVFGFIRIPEILSLQLLHSNEYVSPQTEVLEYTQINLLSNQKLSKKLDNQYQSDSSDQDKQDIPKNLQDLPIKPQKNQKSQSQKLQSQEPQSQEPQSQKPQDKLPQQNKFVKTHYKVKISQGKSTRAAIANLKIQ